jgi:RNA polymerase primary sigma factor
LKKKEAQVIRLRFGIGISEALTLEDVGLRFEVTRERIRQIEAKAIQKLKNPARTGLSQASMDNIRPAIAPSVEDEKNPELPDSASTHAQETKLQEAEQLDGEITISDLDAILLNASELGLHVEDDRSGSSGRIWINLIETPDQAHIRLAWKLIEAGFKCWPDKGYWR